VTAMAPASLVPRSSPASPRMITARRGALLLTGGLLVLYVGLRGTARALGALEAVVG
jgi:hypothetical protein